MFTLCSGVGRGIFIVVWSWFVPRSFRDVKRKEGPVLAVEPTYPSPLFVLCEARGACEAQTHRKGRHKVWTQLLPLLVRLQGSWDRAAAFFPGVKKRNYGPIVPQKQDVLNSSWETLFQVGLALSCVANIT